MTKRIATNVAASVRQRLYNLAKEKQEDFNFVLGPLLSKINGFGTRDADLMRL